MFKTQKHMRGSALQIFWNQRSSKQALLFKNSLIRFNKNLVSLLYKCIIEIQLKRSSPSPNTKLSELLHSFRRASAVFAAARGLTKTCACSCVCQKSANPWSGSLSQLLLYSVIQSLTDTSRRTRGPQAEPFYSSPNSSHLALLIWAQCGVSDMHLCEHLSAVKPQT